MEIRLLLPGDDRREVSQVYEESWRFAYRGIIPQAYLDGIPAGHWAPCLDTPGWHTLLCMENGAMVGTSSFCASRSAQFPGWGEIISLYLLPAYMGRGYGKALLLNALAELDRLGVGEVFLWVLEENRQARQFYSRMGFSPSGGFLEDSIGGKPLRELAYAYKISAWFIRPLRQEERPLLQDFLYEAIFLPEGAAPPPRSILERPELRIYTEGFGARRGDNCLAAQAGGRVVGAVWSRIMEGYGHVDEETPVLAISLYKEYRGRGIGTALLRQMLALLKAQGYKQVSLSVQKANYAVKMYEKAGFRRVWESGEEDIMACRLQG